MFRNPRATLWVCAYQGFTGRTHRSVLNELLGWPNLTYRDHEGQANIDVARSKVASWFLQAPEEEAGSVLLMVDTDTAWEKGDLAFIAKRALEHNAVVGGIYPKRKFGAGAALRVLPETEGTYAIGTDALIPCEFVGTGFIAIPRVVLDELSKSLPLCKGDFWPFFMPFVIRGNEYPTDDQAFCWRVLEAGFKVYASTYPKLTHTGEYTYRMVDADVQPPEDRDMKMRFERLVHA